MRTVLEATEMIARGECCPGCRVEWVKIGPKQWELVHKGNCSYVRERQVEDCAQGEHDVRKSAFECGACGKQLCEICGSDEHRTHEGHDLNSPRYWGV